MVEFLDKQGTVTNYDAVLRNVSDRTGKVMRPIDLQLLLESGTKVYYFTSRSKTVSDISLDEANAVLKVVETSMRDKVNKYPVCISFRKSDSGAWVGCYVGTRYYLYNKQVAQCVSPEVTPKATVGTGVPELTFLQQIYKVLYYKEDWERNGNLLRLGSYITTLRKKIEADMVKGKTDSIIVNNTGTKFVFNSKLLDCFGNYVHIMAEKCNAKHTYVASRHSLLENGFDLGVLNVAPVEFFADIHDVVFKAEFEDIDLSDVAALHHVINDRRYRFPKDIQSKSDMEIMNCLRVSIDHSVKMSKIDYKFVVPMYNIEFDKIQFLMPVYFDFGTSHKADVALVLNSVEGIWQIKTILPLENAFCNARLISNLSTSWLNRQD